MGTDVDLYVERREGPRWRIVYPPPEMRERLHGEGFAPSSDLSGWAWYSGRNYELFALLADVRNRSEIVSPWAHRGLPEGFTRKRTHGHSHSWATLAELQAYDWEGTVVKLSGFMDATEYRHFRDEGDWIGYCQGVGGPHVVQVSAAEMDRMFEQGKFAERTWTDERGEHRAWYALDEGGQPSTQTYYAHVEWGEPMAKVCRWFVERTLPAIAEATGGTPPSDVRLVYWFDC